MWLIVAGTAVPMIVGCAGIAVVVVWPMAVGPSCCTSPGLAVTEYVDNTLGAGYFPSADPTRAKIASCSDAANKRSSAALTAKTLLTTGARADAYETFPHDSRPGPDGATIVQTEVQITVGTGATWYTGMAYFDVTVRPIKGGSRWCVDSIVSIPDPQ
ncbi:hypothetical protein AB0M43_38220 [Longispora sp. NPDC051575]|uniref:hypothetical protein n=1 Tax=Longispora sp. NPDC051575 TaxID=3154943 RepID=UPI003417DE74